MPDNFGPARRQFEDQFEQEGGGLVYRRSLRAAPVPVTASERDSFVADFARAMRRLERGLLAGMILLCLSLAVLTWTRGEPSDLQFYAGVAMFIALYMLLWRRAWNAPARALERRPALGPERSRAYARRLMLERMSWGQLLLPLLLVPVAALRFLDDPGSDWRWCWVGIGLFFAVAVPSLAWRKWRLEPRPEQQ